MRYFWIFLAALLTSACVQQGQQTNAPPEAAKDNGIVGRAAMFSMLNDLEGKKIYMGSLIQDEQRMIVEEDGRVKVTLDSADYLLLVVSHANCVMTPRFISELQSRQEAFESARCRCAAVFFDKEENDPPAALDRYAGEGCVILRDYENRCLRFYIKDKVPAITVIDSWGSVLFWCEGYVSPDTILAKIKSGDFSRVETEAG